MLIEYILDWCFIKMGNKICGKIESFEDLEEVLIEGFVIFIVVVRDDKLFNEIV